jgi:hypothetical protein
MTYTTQEKAKDKRLQRIYGITLKDYNIILAFQHSSCAICKKHVSMFRMALAVDHDHITGLVRGLLCMTCNRALGKFRDNDQQVINAAQYVTQPPATIALGREHKTLPGGIKTKSRKKKIKGMNDKTKSKQARKTCRKQKSI